ncbi:MAG TPA: hypothetical protein VFE33_01350 [Thermoanaerobaculia bacterium]|nr:hypothetical protein [Thermoanaerobaculia bacterium]
MKPAFPPLVLAAVLALAPGGLRGLDFSSSFQTFKVAARPGTTVTRTFELRLSDQQPRVHFKAHIEDWWQSEDGTHSFYREPGTLARSCGRWIALDPGEMAVETGGTLAVRITATIPASAGPGGYWCALTVDELPDPLAPPLTGVGIRFLASISTGIFLFLDPVVRQIEISDVEIAPRRARLTVRNTGNAPVWVDGHVEIFRQGSEEAPVAKADLPSTTLLTGPFARRFVMASLPDLAALPAGRYRVRVILDLGLDHLVGAQKDLVLPNDLAKPTPGR